MPIHQLVSLASKTNVAASFESDSIKIDMPGFAVHAQWDGTMAGTIKLQGRIGNEMRYVDLTGTEQAIESGDSGYLWNLRDQQYTDLKAVVTRSSGTATSFKINFSCKAKY